MAIALDTDLVCAFWKERLMRETKAEAWNTQLYHRQGITGHIPFDLLYQEGEKNGGRVAQLPRSATGSQASLHSRSSTALSAAGNLAVEHSERKRSAPPSRSSAGSGSRRGSAPPTASAPTASMNAGSRKDRLVAMYEKAKNIGGQ
mmetsp:Transcript_32287/g.57098  ORF Transcript_32287/g.57098 Transcript_32287/m.57098 type:complete len:146 (+) Transcript_32287:82-519(+)